MKKFLTIIISLVMVSCMSITAFAASEPTQYSHNMTVSTYSYSTFSYSIPETLEITSNYQSFDVSVGGDSDIDDGHSVVFTINNSNNDGVLLTHTADNTKTIDIVFYDSAGGNVLSVSSNPLVSFSKSDVETGNCTKTLFTGINNPTNSHIKAGTYAGIVTFDVSVVAD